MNNEIKDILVSIIVPVYNVDKYIKKCIESIINQTHKNIEIILVNDGSKDKSLNICKNYKNKDKRIKLINQENGGLPKARNEGLNIAKGKYITFVDSDDYVSENYIERLLSTAIETEADVVESNYLRVDEDGNIQSKSNIGAYFSNNTYEINKSFLENQKFKNFAWNKIFKSSVIKNFRFNPNYKLSEDYGFLSHLYLNVSKKANVEDYLYYYVNRKGSIVNQFFSEKALYDIYVREDILDLYKKNNYKDFYEYVVLKIINLVYTFYNRLNDLDRSKRREIKKKLIIIFKKYYKFAIKSNVRIGGLKLSRKHKFLRYIQYTLFLFNPSLSCVIMKSYNKKKR